MTSFTTACKSVGRGSRDDAVGLRDDRSQFTVADRRCPPQELGL